MSVQKLKLDCDLHAPLTDAQALVESARCYFCHDAPCIEACPTEINIPQFIRKISTGVVMSAARNILAENIMGGTCARVCPVETLCQKACVRNKAEDKPVEIGLLQRFATDAYFKENQGYGVRQKPTQKKVALVGAGPATLSCAHRLASLGHECVIHEAMKKPGGRNEYGLAPYKMTDEWAQDEIAHILSIGGITIKTGVNLGRDTGITELKSQFDAVFLGIGLGGFNRLGISGEDLPFVHDAVSTIEQIRQAPKNVKVSDTVVVIGGGSTAIDIAVEAKILGARDVTIAYRRDADSMRATYVERELAQTQGVKISENLTPVKINSNQTIEFERAGSSEKVTLPCGQVFLAIGQTLLEDTIMPFIEVESGKIMVDQNYMTTLRGVFAGGDCINGGSLTVKAVQDGKLAAGAIDRFLRSGENV